PFSRRPYRELSKSSLGYNRKRRSVYQQPHKIRSALTYSASIAAAFYFGFVGVRYYLPAEPVASGAISQAETAPDLKGVSFRDSTGSTASQAIEPGIEQRQQETLSPAPDIRQITMPEPQDGQLQQLASVPTPPPNAQSDPQWSGDSPSDEVVGAVKTEA